MFEDVADAAPASAGGSKLSIASLTSTLAVLGRVDRTLGDAERVDQIRLLEELKSAAAAAQARVTADFADSQEAAQRAAGVRAGDVGKGVAGQVGLAKRESAHRARRYLGWARILVTELPHTYTALQAGEVTEWQAMLVGRETGWLTREHRAAVDAQLAGRLAAMGDRQVEAETKKLAYRLDPHGAAARSGAACKDRRVSVRPAPDTMSRLTGFLPVAQGVAAYAALKTHADTLIASGDQRGHGQIMADTLVQRLTGQATAAAVPIEVNLVITDQTLFNTEHHTDERGSADDGRSGGGAGAAAVPADEPALLAGYGPIPAPLARRLLADADHAATVWLRRLYTHPDTGQLVAMDSHRRHFEYGLRKFLILRDQYCRMPWCGAPIRHTDHVLPAEDGGPTSEANGQGLCAACNYTKQAPGWTAEPTPDAGGAGGAAHTVTTTTPTGHTYTSHAPDPPGGNPAGRKAEQRAANPLSGTAPPAPQPFTDTPSAMEDRLRALIHAA